MRYIVYRKSSNTNSFGQHKYTILDLDNRRHIEVVATDNWSIGDTPPRLYEHTVVQVGGAMHYEQWRESLQHIAHTVGSTYAAVSPYFSEQFSAPIPPAPPKRHPRSEERPNPHRARLLRALRPHGSGYSTDYGRAQSAIEFDVSCYSTKSWDDYVNEYFATVSSGGLVATRTLLPASDGWWDETAAEFSEDRYRWGHICENMSEMFECDTHYFTHPVTQKVLDIEQVFAGRGGKHLLVTRFEGVSIRCSLTETLRDAVHEDLEHAGITNQWCRDLADMLEWWNSLNISKLVRAEYGYQEAYHVAQLIEQEVDERGAEAARLAAADNWFAVSQA